MGQAQWGVDPDFFGPRHAHREARIKRRLARLVRSPKRHLECAAGVGSLTLALARRGYTVVSADLSLRSLSVLVERASGAAVSDRVLPILADITSLPFADGAFQSVTSAETLEHVEDHEVAVAELARVLAPGGCLVGTVPAGPHRWSTWDTWAGHLRRYTASELKRILGDAGMDAEVVVWGWPLMRLYDELFLKGLNRRRLDHEGAIDGDPTLSAVSALGRRRWLVSVVQSLFNFDRIFDGAPWGVGLLFSARKG